VREDGSVYFSTTSAQLFALKPGGTQLWMYQTGLQADSDPIVTQQGTLIYSSDDGSLYALSPTGMLLWKTDATSGPGEVDGGLAQSCDGRLFAGGSNGWFALEAASGKILWHVPAMGSREAVISSPVVTLDGTMYGFDASGVGVAIDANGTVIWQKTFFALDSAGSSPAYANGVLYVVLNDGKLHAIDAMTAAERWASSTMGDPAPPTYRISGPIVDGGGRIYFNATDGYVYAYEASGSQAWKLAAGGVSGHADWSGDMAIGNDGTLYVPGNDGYLYAFQ
jgi:outer membrane protein assembly factor BamB